MAEDRGNARAETDAFAQKATLQKRNIQMSILATMYRVAREGETARIAGIQPAPAPGSTPPAPTASVTVPVAAAAVAPVKLQEPAAAFANRGNDADPLTGSDQPAAADTKSAWGEAMNTAIRDLSDRLR